MVMVASKAKMTNSLPPSSACSCTQDLVSMLTTYETNAITARVPMTRSLWKRNKSRTLSRLFL